MSEWFDCLIGFGANLGDLHAAFEKTQLDLAAAGGIRELVASAPKLTKPIGNSGQPQYLNAVFRLQTSRSAPQLYEILANFEREAGRDRTGRWQPRTLDLDLLLYGTETIHTDLLRVPHPRMTVRRFVVEPAAEIAGDMVHPVASLNMSELLDRLNQSPNQLVWVTDQNEIAERVISGANRQLGPASSAAMTSSCPRTSGLASWTIIQAADWATFQSLHSTAKIVVWSNPRPRDLQAAHFAGPQIELPARPWTIDNKLLENTIAEFQSEIVAAIEAANG